MLQPLPVINLFSFLFYQYFIITIPNTFIFFILYQYSGTLLFRMEGNVYFNDVLNTFYIRLYGVGDRIVHTTAFVMCVCVCVSF